MLCISGSIRGFVNSSLSVRSGFAALSPPEFHRSKEHAVALQRKAEKNFMQILSDAAAEQQSCVSQSDHLIPGGNQSSELLTAPLLGECLIKKEESWLLWSRFASSHRHVFNELSGQKKTRATCGNKRCRCCCIWGKCYARKQLSSWSRGCKHDDTYRQHTTDLLRFVHEQRQTVQTKMNTTALN